jgi:hypothetical protein
VQEIFSPSINYFSPCDAEKVKTYPVKVSGVEVVPDPVARAQPATFKVKASTGRRQRFNLLLFFICQC